MADKVFLSTAEIYNFYKKSNFTAHSINRDNTSNYDTILINLKNFWKQLKDQEKEIYKALKVNDFEEFNQKFKKLNNASLRMFANNYYLHYLLDNPAINSALASSNNTTHFMVDSILNYVDKKVSEKISKKNIKDSDIVKKTMEAAEEALRQTLKELDPSKRERKVYEQHFINYYMARIKLQDATDQGYKKEDLKQILEEKTKEINMLSRHDKQFIQNAYLNLQENYKVDGEIISSNTTQMRFREPYIEISTKNGKKKTRVLSYYPYIGSSEDLQSIEDPTTIWNQFKSHIKKVVTNDDKNIEVLTTKQIDDIMDALGPEFFWVQSRSQLVGKLGELQAAFLFGALFGTDNIIVSATMRNRLKSNNPELGADIIIKDQWGIQVKNWHRSNTDINAYSPLNKSLTMGTLKERLNEADFQSLSTLLSMMTYNKPASYDAFLQSPAAQQQDLETINQFHEYYEEYKKFYDSNLGENNAKSSTATFIRSLLINNINEFFTIQEIYNSVFSTEEIELINNKDYLNVFYFFGGTDLIPTSRIIAMLIKRIETCIKNFQDPRESRTQFYNFWYNYYPNKESEQWTYDKVWGDQFAPKAEELNRENAPDIDSVLANSTIKVDLQIYVSSLLDPTLDDIKI